MAHGPREGSVGGGPMTAAAREFTGALAPGRLQPQGLTTMALGERGVLVVLSTDRRRSGSSGKRPVTNSKSGDGSGFIDVVIRTQNGETKG
jgi:hypothetical protein